jgi:hypothetical protein
MLPVSLHTFFHMFELLTNLILQGLIVMSLLIDLRRLDHSKQAD